MWDSASGLAATDWVRGNGGTVSPAPLSAAEESQIILQEGLRSGRPVMIPGAFEVRAGRSTASSTEGGPGVMFPMPRIPVPHRTVLERVWRYIMRPTDTPPA